MLTRDQARNIDRYAMEQLAIPGLVLMENAGRSCAQWLIEYGVGTGVVVCCGSGNNGGDGLVIARHLLIAGIKVKIILAAPAEKFRGDAAVNLQVVQRLAIPLIEYSDSWDQTQLGDHLTQNNGSPVTWIVDALLGTGARGPLQSPFDRLVKAINRTTQKKMAIDIPTGMDCDSGEVDSVAVTADVTCTMVDQKAGFSNPAASVYLGDLRIVGIGAPLPSKT